MYEPFVCGPCPLTGCLYNVDGDCLYSYMAVRDPCSYACCDEQYDELMMED